MFLEQEIGLKDHVQRGGLPLFLTLRDEDGVGLVTAMVPPEGREERGFRCHPGRPRRPNPRRRASPMLRWASRLGVALTPARCYPYR